MKRFLLVCFLIGSVTTLRAQEIEPCGFDQLIRDIDSLHPGFSKELNEQYLHAVRQISDKKLNKFDNDTIYRIPVVFQIVYNTNNENLHDSLIHSQLRILNECFRRTNPDTNETRDIFKPRAADTRIEFFMATEDPDGNPTDGIVRTETSLATFYSGANTLTLDAVKANARGGADPWDTDKYLNIWVCDLSFRGIPFLLGYAYPPVNASGWNQNSFVGKERQGVVLHYGMVGENNPFDNAGQNSTGARTAVHEVGHYLGMRHVWGDGQVGQNGCLLDDFIEDTPNTSTRNNSCNHNRNTCTDPQNDLPDMIENYMDYTPGNCVNMFTNMQADLMRYNLINLRSGVAEVFVPEPPIFPATRDELYPVPVEDMVTLELQNVADSIQYTIEITNVLGQLIHEAPYTLDVEKTEIDLSFLTSGMYYFRVLDGDKERYFRRIVKY